MIDPAAIEALAPDDRKLWEALGDAKPLYSSMPTPGAAHSLEVGRFVAQLLGTPMMPWQEWSLRLKSERRPGGKRYRFRTYFETVPRQSGKTVGTRIDAVTKALTIPGRRMYYTAQTGKDAAERWNEMVEAIENSPLASKITKRASIGSQRITFSNGSRLSPFPPTGKSLHGSTPHDVYLDEIFAFDAVQGSELTGAVKPAQVTLEDRQLLLLSTMGNAKSDFINHWVEVGRAATADPVSEIGYLEFALAPGLNAFDPDNWDFHPALGHRITKEDIAEASEVVSRGEFERAYMNRKTTAENSFVPLETWDALAADLTPVSLSEVTVAFDVAFDGSRAAMVAAWYGAEGKICIKVIASAPGAQWLLQMYEQDIKPAKPRAVGADSIGETKAIVDALLVKHPAASLTELKTRDFATACISFKNRIMDGTLVHDGSPTLREAAAAAEIRPLGEGWAFSRSRSPEPICELTAAAVAVRLLETKKKISKPQLFTYEH
ncbi:hypothetical protein E4U03_07830 [Rothia nasimurium]|uniref:Terminase n=1 Tax=Rothia nasimurium TaxID=85336 RepID=A0A4Y9F2J5_9MICC|nr:terminase large subunit [Rothia nasimurium]MBF0808517.1 hypothetical protein [Rothia nasimurium]TFU21911.1 hypothetical protein E4U03_07830 [Rothia nasimurium]